MGYFGGNGPRYLLTKVVPDVRGHFAIWRSFEKKTGAWPIASIGTFLLRFVLAVAGMITILRYSLKHGWTRNQDALAITFLLMPILLLWFVVERLAWNRDLRGKGLSTHTDWWDVDQFPDTQ